MAKISVRSGWDACTRLMKNDGDHAREDAILHNMRLHHRYECLADHRILATMVPEPEYRFYGVAGNIQLHGMAEVQAFYEANWAARSSLVELHVEFVAFGDWGAAAAGFMRQQVPAESAGFFKSDSERADEMRADEAEWYLVETHLSWFFPYEDIDGEVRLGGEVCYVDAGGTTRTPVAPGDVLTLDEAVAQFADTMHLT